MADCEPKSCQTPAIYTVQPCQASKFASDVVIASTRPCQVFSQAFLEQETAKLTASLCSGLFLGFSCLMSSATNTSTQARLCTKVKTGRERWYVAAGIESAVRGPWGMVTVATGGTKPIYGTEHNQTTWTNNQANCRGHSELGLTGFHLDGRS